MAGEPGGLDEATPHELLEGAEYLAERDPAAAESVLDHLATRLDPTQDGELAAWVCYLRARLRFVVGDYDGALAAIRAARGHFLLAGLELQAARTAVGTATVLLELGEFGSVVSQLEHLLEGLTRTQVGPEDEALATLLRALVNSNLGVAYDGLGDHQRALRHLDLAANIYRALGNEAGRAAVNLNRGVAFQNLALPHRALEELVEGFRIAGRLGQGILGAELLLELAETFVAMGRVEHALALLRRLGPPLQALQSPRVWARFELALSTVLLRAGLLAPGHDHAMAAAATFASLGMHDHHGRAQLQIAMSLIGRRDARTAAAHLSLAERLFAGTGAGHLQARTWLAQTWVARITGDDEAATSYATRVVEAMERHGDHVRAGYARLTLAELAEDPEVAEAHIAAVSESAQSFGVPALRMAIEVAQARLDRKAGRVDKAVDRLRRALTIPGQARSGKDWGEFGNAMLVQSVAALDEVVDGLLTLGTHRATREAWQWAAWGKARYREHLHAVAEGWLPEDVAAGSGELDSSDAVEAVLHGMEEFLHDPEGDTDSFYASIARPAVAQGIRLPAIPEGPLVEYHLHRDDVVAFVLRDGQVHARRIAHGVSRTTRLVEDWRLECSRLMVGGETAVNRAEGALAQLQSLLVEPFADLVDDLTGETLPLVGGRLLHEVPFEAMTQADGSLLSERFDLRFVSDVLDPAPRPVRAAGPALPVLVLGLGDEAAPLIEEEARLVAKAWDAADLLIGSRATREAFLAESPGRRLVHVACHGLLEFENPFCSGLRLADGWLLARDVLAADLRGTTVVLSACAGGQAGEVGRVPVGMAWACLDAGASAVVAALWHVDDSVTLEFMQRLHELVSGGRELPAALAQTRRDIAERHPHPYYWASFRLVETMAPGHF